MKKLDPAITGLQSRAASVAPSITRKLANNAMGIEDMVSLWFGEPNVSTPKFICDEAAKSLANGETFYVEGLGKPYLRATIAEYMTDLYGKEIEKDQIAITVSGGNALNLAFQSVLNQGDKVVTLTPAFPNLLSIPSLQGAEVVGHPIEIKNGKWHLDVEAFLAKCDGAKVVLINSPSNPTGFMLEQDEMKQILDYLRKRDIWLISDEVYSRTVYDRKVAPSFLDVSIEEDKLFVVNSFSKSWAMTGWRLGWLTMPKSVTPMVEKIIEFSIACAPEFVQRAANVAIEQGEDFILDNNKKYKSAHDYVVKRLNQMEGVFCPKAESAFYAFFKIDGVNDSVEFAQNLINEVKLGLAPGDAFLMQEAGWFRLCFAQDQHILEKALDRLEQGLAQLPKS